MKHQEIFDYLKTKYGTDSDYSWFDTSTVLRHKENNKWYSLVMEVKKQGYENIFYGVL